MTRPECSGFWSGGCSGREGLHILLMLGVTMEKILQAQSPGKVGRIEQTNVEHGLNTKA